ncbi:hypothetical protein [Paracidovorax konjaci]|uniref:Uncharacterized protein n=1 Tax=Paracidovorax konjaci TaxID=32040 RepID=A0A1I1YBE2_9BURK|nr:hypothetical protein [Paracidovorax konjaci]SFE15200.1 hypothetical protein SAMN04489710_11620 [Paracidovorax konjaci]
MIYRIALFAAAVAGPCGVAMAQGQGSYGGIASGIAQLFLLAILVGALVILLLVRWIFGKVAVVIVLLLMIGSVVYWSGKTTYDQTKREAAQSKIKRAFVEGCAQATRSFLQPAPGNRPVLIRLHGAEVVPEFLHNEVLPSRYGLGEGVMVGDRSEGLADAIAVDITYRKTMLPGSFPKYEWPRIEYDLAVVDLRDGKLIASAHDMQARNGFCLGSLEQFLQKALNRKEVLSRAHAGTIWPPLAPVPDTYVNGRYVAVETGRFSPSNSLVQGEKPLKAFLESKACRVKDDSLSSAVAICGSEAVFSLYQVVDVQPLGDAWLVIYRLFKGMDGLTSLRVEKRLQDWRLAHTWEANFVPAAGQSGDEQPYAFSVKQDGLEVAVYWNGSFGGQRMEYKRRAMLGIPLPGLQK